MGRILISLFSVLCDLVRVLEFEKHLSSGLYLPKTNTHFRKLSVVNVLSARYLWSILKGKEVRF